MAEHNENAIDYKNIDKNFSYLHPDCEIVHNLDHIGGGRGIFVEEGREINIGTLICSEA